MTNSKSRTTTTKNVWKTCLGWVAPTGAAAAVLMAASVAAAQAPAEPAPAPAAPVTDPAAPAPAATTTEAPPPVAPAPTVQSPPPAVSGPATSTPGRDVPQPVEDPDGPPPARRGLQVGVNLGYGMPLGRFDGETSTPPSNPNVRQSNDLSRIYGSQATLTFEVGAKVHENIFVGGYFTGGLGGSGSDFSSTCSQSNVSCLSSVLRIGFAFKYHFIPAGRVNPWLGAGLGYENTSLSARGPGGDFKFSASGPELPLSLGADVRLNKQFAVGPIVDLTVASFQSGEISGSVTATRNGSIDKTDIHSWLTFGARAVFLP